MAPCFIGYDGQKIDLNLPVLVDFTTQIKSGQEYAVIVEPFDLECYCVLPRSTSECFYGTYSRTRFIYTAYISRDHIDYW